MKIKPGEQYRFDYPQEFVTLPEYSSRRGSIVSVLRQLLDADGVDAGPDLERMFLIRAAAGWEGHAFESELRWVTP